MPMRARDHGLAPGLLEPGARNSITDVEGVRVGHGSHAPDRTGVTVVVPHEADPWLEPYRCATAVLNGSAEMGAKAQIDEWRYAETPIALTATSFCGATAAAMTEVLTARQPRIGRDDVLIPVVCETDPSSWVDVREGPFPDAGLVARALDCAGTDVAEGQIGGGIGMESFGHAAGIGTASRRVGRHTVGVLVQANFGWPERMSVCGTNVAGLIARSSAGSSEGSCVCLVATDAPLLPHDLERLARRALLGPVRLGSFASHGSGEVALAWTTRNRLERDADGDEQPLTALRPRALNPLFAAAAEAAEEAILNALCAGRELIGYDGSVLPAFPAAEVARLVGQRPAPPA
jgi:D-aminopeptidase